MSSQVYNWKRFWCPRTAQINLGDRGGYLTDPTSEQGKYHNPELVELEAIADIPCLVLLGEPGIGKSQEMENLRSHTETKVNSDHKVLELNLRSCTSLRDDLFQDEQFIAWKDGIHRLYLFLDSLDEGLLQVQTLATQLVDTLKKNQYRNKLSRLYIRIVCRTAVFPQVLEEGLKELWKEDLAIYELAPLRYADAETAAMEEGIEPQGFLSEVWNKNLVPLAIKPVTLKFLLKIYKQHGGQFSPDQTLCSLYLEGCRLLGKEINLSRHGANLTGNLDSDQRLIVAARIAAVTVFANRFAVWTGINEEEAPAEDVLVRQLILGHESSNGREIEVTEAAIREVLNTGLFSSRGSNRLGWAHQTYAEFLAAWYLNQHNLSLSQIMSLIFHPDGRVVPQLQETTAWLASMRPDVFQEVMKTDPDVLLQSDISTIHDESKAKLVESLLKLHHEEKLEYSRPWRYNNLKYPGLATQLESYIRDFTKNQWSRLVAIDIARHCNVKAVQDSLADIALDPTQLYVVRQHAAHTVCSIGGEATKKRLKPLALSEVGDNLKGYGLRAVWSQHIDTEELLNHLSQPEQREAIPIIGGVYQEFIAIEFAQHLQLSDLPVALKWLEKLPKRYDLHYPFEELADSVMLKAWQNLNEPSVLEAFANTAILRLKQYDGILGYRSPREYTRDSFNSTRDADVESLLKDSKEKRRQLIEKIVLLIPESENDFLWLTDIICSEDTLWMIENVTSAESPRAADIWVKLLHQALTLHNLCWKNTEYIDAVLKACSINSVMRSEFEFDITPIELNSERAGQEKASYLKRQNRLKPPEPEPLIDPLPKQRILATLEKVEAGQPELWWQVCMTMTPTPTSTHWNHDAAFEPDITKLYGWEEAEVETRARIVESAKNYLNAGEPDTQAWIRTSNFSHPPFAGYQALHLLAKQESEFILTISPDTWMKWIPVILKSINFPHRDREGKDEACREIVRTAYQSIPDEFIEMLIVFMTQNNYQPLTSYNDDVYRLTSELLDQCLASLILSRVSNEDLNAGMLEILLTDLFKHDVDRAKSIAASFIATTVPKSEEARNKAIVAARMLIIHADNSSWSVLWSVIQQDHAFGREVLESIAFQAAHEGQIEQNLKDEYLADLYIFLAQQYPEIERSEPETYELRGIQAQILRELDSIGIWKNSIPQRLQARGTQEACNALQKIIHELPGQKEQLQQRLLETKNLARRRTWNPPKPEEILQLVHDLDKYLVQNGQQLLNVLIESLQRLDLELQSETPATRDLWDKNPDKKNLFRPIDENAFSDYVKRFLDKDLKSRGIIVNREVELRRSYGGNPGERTDIHVDAVLKSRNGGTYDSVTVIVEVKGCWHSEVQTAMKTQLVDRYLADNGCPYGLYLVGWFNCQQWDDQDSRKKQTPKMSLDEARTQLNEQAQHLTLSGNTVRAYVLNTALR